MRKQKNLEQIKSVVFYELEFGGSERLFKPLSQRQV